MLTRSDMIMNKGIKNQQLLDVGAAKYHVWVSMINEVSQDPIEIIVLYVANMVELSMQLRALPSPSLVLLY